jgi:hypothetical protein
MNLSDELKKMRNRGRQVVSIDYVIDRLRLMENDNKTKSEQLTGQSTKAV